MKRFQKHLKCCTGEKGFSLLETLIAMVVLSIGIMGYMSIHYQSINGRLFSKRMHEAVMTANSLSESLMSGDYEELLPGTETVHRKEGGIDADSSDFDNGSAHEIEWSVSQWGDELTDNPNAEIRNLKTLSLSTRWKERDRFRSTRVNTLVRNGKIGDSEGE